MSFKCWKCGACCRFAGFVDPDLDRGDSACKHLQEDNTCGIYEDRPDFCRLDPSRPEKEQEKLCRLMEANWKKQVKVIRITRGLTDAASRGILPVESDEG